jgi:integrase
VLLCECPTGQEGRPSKAFTLDQAESLLTAALEVSSPTMRAYVAVSLLAGARTEEMRALTWSHVDLQGNLDATPPLPASIQVWRSVRGDGDTKTRKSRRTLAMPQRCVDALEDLRETQGKVRTRVGEKWQDNDLVFATRTGTELLAGNVRRAFRLVAKAAGLEAGSGRRVSCGTASSRCCPTVGANRGDLSPLRPQGVGRHRADLPAPAQPDDGEGGNGDERDLPADVPKPEA